MGAYFLTDARKRLMSQAGVKQYLYGEDCTHNAIWDSAAGPDGKLYYALATEIATAGYVRFCSWDYNTGEVSELFRVEDVILPQDRAIRASKFHSSIGFMPDGRVIMTTHTTDKSPRHPTWMPYAYYNHLWEGFAGGQIIVYDPSTKKAECLGTPVPHESIYGALYEEKHNALFFTGMMRGHLYRYSLDDKTVVDLGKTSENYAFRLALGIDGNVYGASRSGWLYKVDTDTLEISDMGFQFEHEPFDYSTRFNNLSIARTGPDGRLYMAGMYSRSFYALDTDTGRVEDMGWYLPTPRYSPDENRHGVFGMDFDQKGVLWYAVTSLNNYESNLEFGIPASLFRWDIARGGKPEWAGLLGTPERGGAWISEVCVNRDGILFAVNSNHSLDGPGLIGVDLEKFEPTIGTESETLKDEYFNPASPRYIACAKLLHEQERIMAQNPCAISLVPAYPPVLLWRELAGARIGDSAVKSLFWDESAEGAALLRGVCAGKNAYSFVVRDGKLISLTPVKEGYVAAPRPCIDIREPLPHYPGRQYKAVVSATAQMSGARTLVGTEDGMIAIIRDGAVYALGPAGVNGPVRCMSSTPDGKTVYGVVGDEADISSLFSYDDVRGLRWLGYFERFNSKSIDDIFYMTQASACAVSPDGKYLAVGCDERFGTVVIYQL